MTLNRRAFLQRGTASIAAASVADWRATLAAAEGTSGGSSACDRVLVVVNLVGGNDGLNSVVPLERYGTYRDLRPSIALPLDSLVPLEGNRAVAFAPGLGSLAALHDLGDLAAILGLAHRSPLWSRFDHEKAQYLLQSGRCAPCSDGESPTGWLGRALDALGGEAPEARVNVGAGGVLLAGGSPPRNERIFAAGDVDPDTPPPVPYPRDDALGRALRGCARAAGAGRGTLVFSVGCYGFDTHAGGPDARAYHDGLLASVGDAVSAFYADLCSRGLRRRSLVLVVSEFGRSAAENAAGGTDHGFPAVFFAVGGAVRPGVFGEHARLDRPGGASFDYRSVFATVVERFLGVDSTAVFDETLPLVDFL